MKKRFALTPTTASKAVDSFANLAWESAVPTWSVVVSSFRRSDFLPDLFECLQSQGPQGGHELVVVDNGSLDETWEVLCREAERCSAPTLVVQADLNRGPGSGRNLGVGFARGTWVAFTDDDCLPEHGWLKALEPLAQGEVVVVQGRVKPHGRPLSPWDRTITVPGPTPTFETANIAYRRDVLTAIGGFVSGYVSKRRSSTNRQPFGEDAILGDMVVPGLGGRAFASDAMVRHRWLPGTFMSHAAERRRMALFPALLQQSATLRANSWHGPFLARSTALFDLALLGLLASFATSSPLPLVTLAPWVRDRLPETRQRTSKSIEQVAVITGLFLADCVGLIALLIGSANARKLVL